MSENEYLQQVIENAVQGGRIPQTHLQQIVAEHMIGEMDGSTPGSVENVIRKEIGRRVTTPRYPVNAAPAR